MTDPPIRYRLGIRCEQSQTYSNVKKTVLLSIQGEVPQGRRNPRPECGSHNHLRILRTSDIVFMQITESQLNSYILWQHSHTSQQSTEEKFHQLTITITSFRRAFASAQNHIHNSYGIQNIDSSVAVAVGPAQGTTYQGLSPQNVHHYPQHIQYI